MYIGKLPQYKPSSLNRYRTYRDSLIALLPLDHKKKPVIEPTSLLKVNELLQNTPNPFSATTDIWFKLAPNCYQVKIKITDNLGRTRNNIGFSDLSEGLHRITVDASGLTPGIYQYSLEVNGQLKDTKKMVVIR